MNLLVQSLGVTAGGVYWAETGGDKPSPRWTPISVYPDQARGIALPAVRETMPSSASPTVYEAQEVQLDEEWTPEPFEGESGGIAPSGGIINQEIIDGGLMYYLLNYFFSLIKGNWGDFFKTKTG